MTCIGEAFKGFREGGGKESARTEQGNGDNVVVARWVLCRPSEPVMAHNLARIRTAVVRLVRVADNIALQDMYCLFALNKIIFSSFFIFYA